MSELSTLSFLHWAYSSKYHMAHSLTSSGSFNCMDLGILHTYCIQKPGLPHTQICTEDIWVAELLGYPIPKESPGQGTIQLSVVLSREAQAHTTGVLGPAHGGESQLGTSIYNSMTSTFRLVAWNGGSIYTSEIGQGLTLGLLLKKGSIIKYSLHKSALLTVIVRSDLRATFWGKLL